MGWWLFIFILLLSLSMGPFSGSLARRRVPGGIIGGMYVSLLGACLGIVIAHKLGVEDLIGGYGWCWLGALLGGVIVPLAWSFLGEEREPKDDDIIEESEEEEIIEPEESSPRKKK